MNYLCQEQSGKMELSRTKFQFLFDVRFTTQHKICWEKKNYFPKRFLPKTNFRQNQNVKKFVFSHKIIQSKSLNEEEKIYINVKHLEKFLFLTYHLLLITYHLGSPIIYHLTFDFPPTLEKDWMQGMQVMAQNHRLTDITTYRLSVRKAVEWSRVALVRHFK